MLAVRLRNFGWYSEDGIHRGLTDHLDCAVLTHARVVWIKIQIGRGRIGEAVQTQIGQVFSAEAPEAHDPPDLLLHGDVGGELLGEGVLFPLVHGLLVI